LEADSKGPQKLKIVPQKSCYGRVEEVEEVEANSIGPQKLKNVPQKSWYGRVEEVEEVEANSIVPQKQPRPFENFVNPLMFTLHYIIIYKYI
jgi:hypothetical protein